MSFWNWLLHRKKREADLEEEIQGHLRMAAQERHEQGEAAEQARTSAVREFGNVTLIREVTREMWGFRWLETLLQDIRYGVRLLRKNPGFTAVAVLTLALGIGANTAIFSLLDAVMLRFLPIEKPEELVEIVRRSPRGGNQAVSSFTNPIWEQFRNQQDVFSGVFGWDETEFDLARGGEAHYARGLWVTGDFFRTLGVQPAAGRLITLADDQRGCSGAAVLSYSFWQEHLAGAESAVGSTISLDNHTYPILGVAARGFNGVEVGKRFDVALPVCATAVFDGARPRLDHRSWWWLHIMGRVKPEISADQVRADLGVLSPRIFAATVPQNWDQDGQKDYLKWSLTAAPAATGTSGLRAQFAQPLNILMAVVAIVLVIACANIASLMVARAAVRNREMAVRRALGASRMRLIRQLLTECVMLSMAGALLGILFARWGSMLLVRFISTAHDQVFLDLSLDGRVLGFTAAIAIFTGLLFGVLPAFRTTRVSLTAAMKGRQATDVEHRVRLRPGRWIVASQMALSLVVLVAAGLLLRSFAKLVMLDIGFDRNNILMMHTEARTAGIPPEKWMATWDEIERRISSLPGVVSASRALMTPISGSEWNQLVHADSPNPPAGDAALTYLNAVSPGYFRTLHIPLLAGRDFNAQDTPTMPKVAIINQTVARKFYPNFNPVGRFFRLGEDQGKLGPPIQIVGVVRDSKYVSLREETPPTAFFPITQEPGFGGGPNFLIRTSTRPSAVLSLIRAAVADVDKSISLDFNTLAQQVDDSLIQERVLATLSGFFGGLALLLAMIGLYGAMSYMVTQRQTEFGVRMALGAARGSILRLVLRDVVTVIVAGVMVGASISLLSVQLLQKFLFGLAAHDTLTLALAIGVLSVVAFIAGYLPARRATKVDPMVALRYE
ncbi:MAG: ABC transporter permease [Terriglobia bacterium]|jgi:predicted permease